MKELPVNLQQLIAVVDRPDGEPLQLLTDAVILSGRLGDLGDDLVDHFVQKARDAGASWADIGQGMGVSKQAAQKRFVKGRRGWTRPGKGLFTRFAESARSMVWKAVAHAEELGSEEVSTLHLVMALAEPESGPAHRAISDLAGSAQEVADAARTAIGPTQQAKKKHRPFSSDAKKVLELSLRETIRLESRQIGTEHILLGLLRDEKSSGATVLSGFGVTHEGVEAWLEESPPE